MPQFFALAGRRQEPWSLDLVDQFSPYIIPSWKWKQCHNTSRTIESIDFTTTVELNKIVKLQSRIQPDWTNMAQMWYTSTRDAIPIVEALKPHTGNLLIQCCGTKVVPDLDEDVVIGYDCRLTRRKAPLPPPPVEQLIGRRVVLVGGEPPSQWRNYCTLALQGVDVVGVRLSANWYMTGYTGDRYWGPDLYEHQTESKMPKEPLVLQSLQNVLSFWDAGLTRARQGTIQP